MVNNNATLEHEMSINGLTVVESWIVEDSKMDKSAKYGLEARRDKMISMKVENDEVWNEYVKTEKVKGSQLKDILAEVYKTIRLES